MVYADVGAFTTGDLVTGSDLDTLGDAVAAIASSPWTVQIIPAAGGWVENQDYDLLVQNNQFVLCSALDASGVVNAYVGWDIVLSPGTWTMEVMYKRDVDSGILTITLDGTTIATIDTYGSSAVNTTSTTTGIVTTSSTTARLKVTVATKNASADRYRGKLNLISFKRTA